MQRGQEENDGAQEQVGEENEEVVAVVNVGQLDEVIEFEEDAQRRYHAQDAVEQEAELHVSREVVAEARKNNLEENYNLFRIFALNLWKFLQFLFTKPVDEGK